MDRFYYVYTIASKYAPPDLYEDEDGTVTGDYPEEVTRYMGIVSGYYQYDFPCQLDKFLADSDIMNIVDSYNKRIGENGIKTEDGKTILTILRRSSAPMQREVPTR